MLPSAAYRLLRRGSGEWRGYAEYAIKMATLTAIGVCFCFLFATLLLLGAEVPPPLPDEAGVAVAEVRHAWRQYRRHSWGANELAPETLSPSSATDGLVGSASGLTIVESLGVLHLMQLTKELQQAEAWVAASFNFTNVSREVSTPDVSSRLLGGLLSAFSLTEKPLFLYKALQVAEGLLVAFDTPSGLPAPSVVPLGGPAAAAGSAASPNNRHVSLSQMSQLYLEFAFLARLTGLQKYSAVRRKLLLPLLNNLRLHRQTGGSAGGPWSPPNMWDTATASGQPVGPLNASANESVALGILTLAEVAIKAHLLLGDRDALEVFQALLLGRLNLDTWLSCPSGRKPAAATVVNPPTTTQCRFDLRTCRLVETLLLGLGASRDPIAQRDFAYRLGDLCEEAAHINQLRLTPDALLVKQPANDHQQLIAREADGHYAGQPDPVLAGLLVWSRRRRQSSRQTLSGTLKAMTQHLRSPSGYRGFTTTATAGGGLPPMATIRADNRQPSYLLAQTFKYIYMAFEPSQLNLVSGDWLFNTAGHLLPVSNGQRFDRLRALVKDNWSEVRRLLGDLERLKVARRRGQAEAALGAGELRGRGGAVLAAAVACAAAVVAAGRQQL